jgi:drug/metabolite transporter (DMT)-like permease
VGVALGLGAALLWGLADYFAAVASRSRGALRVVLGFHLAALIPLTVLVLATDGLARVSSGQVALLALVGAVGWVSYLAFYGALAIGPISVLSPIVSGYAAVTVLLAVVVTGNHLSAAQAVAVAATIAGAMVASADVRAVTRAKLERRSALGFLLALAAMALLGAFVFGVSYYRRRVGWLGPIFLARGFATVFLLGHVLARGARSGSRGRATGAARSAAGVPATRRRAEPIAIVGLLALLDTGGYVCFNLGVGHAATAIVAAASAPYATVPIVMGVSLFGERPTRTQWLGVGLVLAGVIVLGAVA